jgi:hypothetical protein
MTARKRKPADRRRAPVRRQALVLRVLSGAAGLVARYPRTLGGSVALFVVFSFIAANALWYQPRNHPHPFLATRDPQDPNAIAGYQPQRRVAPEDVTTFRIERAPEVAPQETANLDAAPQPASSVEPLQTSVADVIGDDTEAAAPNVVPLPRPSMMTGAGATGTGKPAAADPVAAAIRAADLRADPAARPSSLQAAAQPARQQAARQQAARPQPSLSPPADIPAAARASKARQAADMKATPVSLGSEAQLVLQIQQGLSNIAYSDVSIDGVAGEQTRAAIRHFQKHYRLPVDGEPSEAVLSKLKSIGAL